MEILIALRADILCEGHFGVYEPNERVTEYIEHYLMVSLRSSSAC